MELNYFLNFFHFTWSYECGRTDILYQAEIGVWILALRAVSSVPLSVLADNTFDSIRGKVWLNGHNENESNIRNLIACSKLVTHNGSDKFSGPELMKESIVAVFLTRCLQSRGYFNDKDIPEENTQFTGVQKKVSIWIYNLMRVAKFNSHEVTEIVLSNEKRRIDCTDSIR